MTSWYGGSVEDCPSTTCQVGERATSGLGAIQLPPGFDWGDIPAPSAPTEFSTGEIVGKTLTYAIAMLFGVTGNVLIILIVVFSKRMHSMTNFYVANLAASDLMVSCFCMWVHMGSRITSNWPFGSFICKFYAFVHGKIQARTFLKKVRLV